VNVVTVTIGEISATRCGDGTVCLEGKDDGDTAFARSTDELRAILDVLDAAAAIADKSDG